jgi:hypothetical protein
MVLTAEASRNVSRSPRANETKFTSSARIVSPYATHNLDAAIAHLEVAVAAECREPVLGVKYWRRRVLQVASTGGIQDAQLRRLQQVLVGLPGPDSQD